MFDFKDQVILVSGAAGNLGKAVVDSFLESGGTVCGVDYRSDRLDALFRDHPGAGSFFCYEGFDVTDKKEMIRLAKSIRTKVGDVQILVNTVGGFNMGEPVYGLSYDTWDRMIDLNVHSFLSLTAAFVPAMIENNKGKVISVGAKTALAGGARMGAYSAAKAALIRLTESLAQELKNYNIQVNSVLPGTIDTPENRKDMPQADFSKWVKPHQLAEVILFLASSASDGITGAAIPV